METILTVNNEYLKNLSSTLAVEFFRDLIWAESRKLGITPSKVNISLRVNVADGGVDATVDANSQLKAGGLIESGQNSYQIKTGESFKPNQESAIKKELFGDKTPSKENLAQEVKSCLEQNGRYVLVCFGLDSIGLERNTAIKNLKDCFATCGYLDARVDVWSTNILIPFIQDFPALVLRINRIDGIPFRTHAEWSKQEDMITSFEVGQEQQQMIDNVREQLRKNDEAVHLRILGEPGVGKTRLVLEATNTNDLRSLVIYASASNFYDSRLMMGMIRNENMNVIAVIDECDPDQRARIWNSLKDYSPRIKLVTIYNEWENVSGINFYEITGLSDEHIKAIIESHGVPKFEAGPWIEECSGSPRVAHVVGANLSSNPEDMFKSPAHVNIWDRYICGMEKSDSENVRQRRIVLQHIALFKRFGYKMPLENEAKVIHTLVQEADTDITWYRFRDIISQLQNRRILQGETTLYITPKLLHAKLWIDWWNIYEDSFDLNRVDQFPPKLKEWFLEMFEYAQGSRAASEKAKELLGIFQRNNGELLKTGFGARFFYHLAYAEPEAALRCLQQTIGKWSKEELLQLNQTRSLVVSSLEYIALWENLFPEAAKLILALGEAENQTYSNNASGVFADLFGFSLHRELSKTEAPPSKRIPILREALSSESPECRNLGLQACKNALSWIGTGMLTDRLSIVGKKPNLWYPKTYGELFEAYSQVWQLLFSALDNFPSDDQKKGAEIILNSVQHLGSIPSLNEMILKDLKLLLAKNYVPKEHLVATVIQFVHHSDNHIPTEFKAEWEEFQKQLTGNKFHDLLVRYIAMNLMDYEFENAGDAINAANNKIGELADYSILNPDELKAELEWLMSNDFYKARGLALEIGKRDENRILLSAIVDTVKHFPKNGMAASFLGSYLWHTFVVDKNLWLHTIYSFKENVDLVEAIPLVIRESPGLTDESANLLLNLGQTGKIELVNFSLFTYGGNFFENVSQNIIDDWLKFLLSQNTTAMTLIALATYYHIYIQKDKVKLFPEDLTLHLLTHQTLFTPSEKNRYDVMASYHWKGIAKQFIEQYPSHALTISGVVLEHLGIDGTLSGIFHRELISVVEEIAREHPEQVWLQISKYLDPPFDERAFSLTHWLHGDAEILGEEDAPSPLILFSPNLVWAWVDKDVDNRAWYLATFVPRTLRRNQEEICWARELLIRYGDLESVRRNLTANFCSGGWSGPATLFYSKKKEKALEFLKDETDPKVIKWLNEYLESLERSIQREKIDEEREDF